MRSILRRALASPGVTQIRRHPRAGGRSVRFLSFPNHIRASLVAHPNLVFPTSVDVHPGADAKSLLLRLFVVRIGYCQLPGDNKMCRQARMLMWVVVRITSPA